MVKKSKTIKKPIAPKKPVGKYATVEEIDNIFNLRIDFSDENDMCDYIEMNIKLFCKEVLDDQYLNYRRQFVFNARRKNVGRDFAIKGIHNIRADFFIICKNGKYIVEVKNPVQTFTELSRTIGQLMMYEDACIKNNIKASVVLVSSKNDKIVTDIIKRYDLPYKYIVFNREFIAQYKEVV